MGESADGASASGDGLYGGAAAGILETNDLKFHHLHGRNARISNNGATASRPNALGEFNDAIIMSNRFAYFFFVKSRQFSTRSRHFDIFF